MTEGNIVHPLSGQQKTFSAYRCDSLFYTGMIHKLIVRLFVTLLCSTLQKFGRLVLWDALFILELHFAETQAFMQGAMRKLPAHGEPIVTQIFTADSIKK